MSKPITRKWLKSVGFCPVPSDMGPSYSDHYEKGVMNIWEFNGTGDWLYSPADTITMRTSKHVKMLAELLGVDLTPVKHLDRVKP